MPRNNHTEFFSNFESKLSAMKSKNSILFFYLLLIFNSLFIVHPAICQNKIPDDFCISNEDYKLFNLINSYRKTLKLPAVELSKSLCYVARQHVSDLITNNPDTNTCNFHSWSNKGNWTPCCFEGEAKNKACMQNKPRELTNYKGNGYELVYWENREASADKAFDQWRETNAARAMITNAKDWEIYNWNALGVSIDGGFASAWFGQDPDVEKETKICGSEMSITNKSPSTNSEPLLVSSATGRFYLIYGNFNTLEDAKAHLKKYQNEGFDKVKIVSKDSKFRISLSDYSTKELATKAKKELPVKYKDAWILPY